MFPFTALQKINCFHATICTGGQGLHPAHNDTVYQQIPREQCTYEGLHCSASSCFPSMTAPGLGGREGLHCLKCPRALAPDPSQLPASLCQQALASAQCQGCRGCSIKKRPCHHMHLQHREPNPALDLSISSEWAWQTAASVLWPPQSWQPSPSRHTASKGTVQAVLWLAAALLASLCRLQQDGCTQLCQSVPTSQLAGADRHMTCYIFSYF